MKPLEDSIDGLAGKFICDGLTPDNFTLERAEQICRNTVVSSRNLTVLRLYQPEIIESMRAQIEHDEDEQSTEQLKIENKDITFP